MTRNLIALVFIVTFFLGGCATHSPAPVTEVAFIGSSTTSEPGSAKHTALSPEKSSINDQSILGTLNRHIHRWQGTRHRLGGTSRSGVDCSAFVQLTYKELFSVNLPRTTKHQAKEGRRVRKDAIQPGDLVFFKTGIWGRHVGIYTDHGKFVHASRKHGVTQTSLNSPYWHRHYWKSKRILTNY